MTLDSKSVMVGDTIDVWGGDRRHPTKAALFVADHVRIENGVETWFWRMEPPRVHASVGDGWESVSLRDVFRKPHALALIKRRKKSRG